MQTLRPARPSCTASTGSRRAGRRLMLAVLATAAACAPPPAGGAGAAPPPSATAVVPAPLPRSGTWVNGAITRGERPRYYRLYLPAGHDPGSPRMLVVLLHGCAQDPNDFARGTRIAAHADENQFIVLLPQQSPDANASRCWNWYDPAHQARGAGEPALIAAMIDEVARTHRVDPARVHLAGFGAGAAMVQNVAVAYPERWASIALHSAIPWKAAEDALGAAGVMQRGALDLDALGARAAGLIGRGSPPIPALVIHGQRDAVVHPLNGTLTARRWTVINARLWAGFRPQGDAVATVESSGESGGYRWTRTVYGSPRSSLVELLVVPELGHAWSGGSTEGSLADERGPDATADIVRFFRAHPRPATR